MDWIHLARDGVQWRGDGPSGLMKDWGGGGDFLTSLAKISFPRTLLHELSYLHFFLSYLMQSKLHSFASRHIETCQHSYGVLSVSVDGIKFIESSVIMRSSVL
jgi:hypothetical protein